MVKNSKGLGWRGFQKEKEAMGMLSSDVSGRRWWFKDKGGRKGGVVESLSGLMTV